MAPLRFAGVIMLSMPVSEADKGAKKWAICIRNSIVSICGYNTTGS